MTYWTIMDPEGRPLKDPSGRFSALFDDITLAQQALVRAQRVCDARCALVKLARPRWVPEKAPPTG